MTITYNTLLPRDAINTHSIRARVTEKGRGSELNNVLEPNTSEVGESDQTDNYQPVHACFSFL